MPEKLNAKFFTELIKDSVGYESGMLKTLVDLFRKPNQIIQSLNKGENTYVKPSKFFLNCCGYFILVNSFFIDWTEVGERQDAEFRALSASGDTNTSFGVLLDFLFSWAFVPVSLLFAVLKLIFVINFSKKLNVQVQDQVAIVFYGASMSIISTFVIGLTVAFLPFVYGLSITILASMLFYTFPKKFGYIKSPIDFLPGQGKELQKVHSRASLMLVLISAAFVLLYVFLLEKYFIAG
jgi:hypothetical protein